MNISKKTIVLFIIYLFQIISAIIVISIIIISINRNTPYSIKVELPTNYRSINPSERLIGYFDKDSVLHISIDNSIRFEWKGSERDIPEDGKPVLIEKTEENIIYLNNLK